MASYLSLNADEAYKLGGKYNGETGSNRHKVITYDQVGGPWFSQHGVTYRNTTGFSGSTRVMAKADVYQTTQQQQQATTFNTLVLPAASREVTQGRYAMAGPLIGDTTGGNYEDNFRFHIEPLFDDQQGNSVPNPYYTGEITTQGEFNYGGIYLIYTETEPAGLESFSVENGTPCTRGYRTPLTGDTIRVSNFLRIRLGGLPYSDGLNMIKGKKFGFVCGNNPASVAYVAQQASYPSNTQYFHVGTGVTHGGFVSATSTQYTKVTFGDIEIAIPPQSALERAGFNGDGFMIKFKSNATFNDYGYEVLPIIYTVSNTTYYAIIYIEY